MECCTDSMYRALHENADQNSGTHWVPFQPFLEQLSAQTQGDLPGDVPIHVLASHDLAELKPEDLELTMTTSLDTLANYQQQRLIVTA